MIKKFFIIFILTLIAVSIFTFKIENKQDIVKIKFSTWGSKTETDILKSIVSKFENENPEIKIELLHIPQNYFQKIHLLFASGLESDVIFFNNQNIQMYINAGLLEDLSPYFDNIENEFYSQTINCFKKDGKLFAVPRDISNLVIYYNKDIFRQQNVKMPSKIKDIFELRELAKKVNSSDNFGINFEENPSYWLYYLASNGGGVISDDKKDIIINNAKSIEALSLYSDMINKDKTIPKKSDIASMTSAQMFINGKLAMYLSGRWMSPKFRETIDFDWDIAEFPSPNKVYLDSSGWSVSKKSKHKKQAVEFIKYLSSKEIISEFTKTGLIIPARKDVDIQEQNQSSAFITMIKNSKPTPVNENYSAILDILTDKTENIFNGTENAKDVFDEKTLFEMKKLL